MICLLKKRCKARDDSVEQLGVRTAYGSMCCDGRCLRLTEVAWNRLGIHPFCSVSSRTLTPGPAPADDVAANIFHVIYYLAK